MCVHVCAQIGDATHEWHFNKFDEQKKKGKVSNINFELSFVFIAKRFAIEHIVA